MKKIPLILICFILLFSCEQKLPERTYNARVSGAYKNVRAYTDIPLDLDFNGTASANMYDELTCGGSFKTYGVDLWCYKDMATIYLLDMVSTESRGVLINTGCYMPFQIRYGCRFDGYNFQIENEEHSNDEQKFAHIKSIVWSNDTLYCDFTKQFYTPDGWQVTDCTYVYVKYKDEHYN
jgi:hypothetical protein